MVLGVPIFKHFRVILCFHTPVVRQTPLWADYTFIHDLDNLCKTIMEIELGPVVQN